MQQSKCLTIILSILTAVFIFTVSVATPILLRPFYYLQIGPLALEETSGLPREQIICAYNEMMDFCTGRTQTFSTGSLPWSQSGKDHFADVRALFLLDLRAAVVTGLLLLGWTLAGKGSRVQPYRFRKRGFAFWGCVGLGGVFLMIGALAATNFSGAFLLFHRVFFPGKDNWVFDPHTDGVIRILPQVFFRNCAVFILIIMILLCTVIILRDVRKK